MIDEELLCKCIKCALRRGGEYADVFWESRDTASISLDDDKVEKTLVGHTEGIGIRLIYNHRTAYGFSNDISVKGLLELAEGISKIASSSSKDMSIDLRHSKAASMMPIIKPAEDVGIDIKTQMLQRGNRTARAYDHCIKQVRAVYADLIQDVLIATSDGIIAYDHRSYITAMLQAVAADGNELQTGYESVGGMTGFEIFDEKPFEEVSLEAAKRSVKMLRAPRMKGGRMPVIISSSAGGTMIHEAVGHGLEADLAMQGFSVYSNRIGEVIASSVITVIDDGTLPGKRGSYGFDDEGNPSSSTILIEGGILRSYLCDKLNSLKYGIPITGNGRRESFMCKPIPRMTNTFIAPGKDSPEEIISGADKGLFVKKMGGGQVNTVTGDFVFEVQEGYVIEKGLVGNAVRGVTLIGRGEDVLKAIDRVGSDLGFSIGTCGKDGQGVPVSDAMPTVRIPEMVVGGES